MPPKNKDRQAEAIAEALTRRQGGRARRLKPAKVKAVLDDFDEDAERIRASAQVRYEIWDGQSSPVATMTSEEFHAHLRRRLKWDGQGTVILGYDGGRLTVIQPTAPGGNAPMDVQTAVEIGANMAESAMAGRVFAKALDHVSQGLRDDEDAWEEVPTVSPVSAGGVRGETRSKDSEEA
jgi:hypothetical protein